MTCARYVINIGDDTYDYAYSYWEDGKEAPGYACFGPLMQSMDGEYRAYFDRWETINGYLTAEESDEFFNEIMDHTEQALETAETVAIITHTHPKNSDVERNSDNMRLQLILLALALNVRVVEVHTIPVLEKIRTALYGADFKFSNNDSRLSHVLNNSKDANYGQKTNPVNVRSLTQLYEFTHPIWREVLINMRASNSFLSGQCPSFVVFYGWSLIDGTGPHFYTHPSIKERFAISKRSERTIDKLNEARATTQDAEGRYDGRIAESLDDSIAESLIFAHSHMRLDTHTMLMLFENRGVSIDTFIHLLYTRPHRYISKTPILSYCMFQLSYALSVLHNQVGAIHGDLHLGNATVYVLPDGGPYMMGKRVAGGEVFYLLSDALADSYVLPWTGVTCSIIDFGRIVLGPSTRPDIVKIHSQHYARDFYKSQARLMIELFDRFIGDTYVRDHEEEIRAAIYDKFDLAYNVLTCIDYIALASLIVAAMSKYDDERKEEFDVAAPRLILETARTSLRVGLRAMVDPRTRADAADTWEPMGNRIIRKVFSRYHFTERAGSLSENVDQIDARLHDLVKPCNIPKEPKTVAVAAYIAHKTPEYSVSNLPPWVLDQKAVEPAFARPDSLLNARDVAKSIEGDLKNNLARSWISRRRS
jgi:hypothetical protein